MLAKLNQTSRVRLVVISIFAVLLIVQGFFVFSVFYKTDEVAVKQLDIIYNQQIMLKQQQESLVNQQIIIKALTEGRK